MVGRFYCDRCLHDIKEYSWSRHCITFHHGYGIDGEYTKSFSIDLCDECQSKLHNIIKDWLIKK